MKSLGLVLCCLSQLVGGQRKQPNIIFILADDLGWNDVSWHNPDMPTTAMERLTKGGVRLDQSYSQQVCTPSRAALLTGKYPFHIGRQKERKYWRTFVIKTGSYFSRDLSIYVGLLTLL